MHALVAEAIKKASIIWVSTATDQSPYPLWCLPSDGSLYVVTGGAEQPAPGLIEAHTATVAARGDHGGRIATWRVTVDVVAPGDEEWSAIALPLAGKRLNSPESAAELVEVWATGSTVVRLSALDDELLPAT
ncbi:MAG TPA: hypothetical protein VGF84_00445 [Micromonosporaceae bacterium]|jgi:hypothetical protein